VTSDAHAVAATADSAHTARISMLEEGVLEAASTVNRGHERKTRADRASARFSGYCTPWTPASSGRGSSLHPRRLSPMTTG
jgi:hypothetical protein